MNSRSNSKTEEVESKSFGSTAEDNELHFIAPAQIRRFPGTFSSKPTEINLSNVELNHLILSGKLVALSFFSLPPEHQSEIPITQNISRNI